ncbi:MAG: zinc ribbon domain-containing protein [Phycisphaerales bacterium]|nr:zinc ribbon domain-containing protein [Phycisphaerales bacterium]
MPTYDYVCDGCGHAFELFQGMSDSVKRSCPECKARKLRRLIGTGAAILVGGRSSDPGPSSRDTSSENTDSSDSTSHDSGSSDDTTSTSTEEKVPEQKMSGSTSTPTHEAREHRGVGNLVDAARRTRKADSKPKDDNPGSGGKSTEGGKPKPKSKAPKRTTGKSTSRSKTRQTKSSPKKKRGKGS